MVAKNRPDGITTVSLAVTADYVRRFLFLLTEGVSLPVRVGGSLKEIVCGQLGVDETYFEDRIQTIFLNYKAVDEPEKALVEDGAVIALSAAMPGLVGATMRRGGVYAALRRSISFVASDEGVETGRGFITLKLLNLVARELGPQLLACGVQVQGEKLASFFENRADDVRGGCIDIAMDGTSISWAQLMESDLPRKEVLFKVTSKEDS